MEVTAALPNDYSGNCSFGVTFSPVTLWFEPSFEILAQLEKVISYNVYPCLAFIFAHLHIFEVLPEITDFCSHRNGVRERKSPQRLMNELRIGCFRFFGAHCWLACARLPGCDKGTPYLVGMH